MHDSVHKNYIYNNVVKKKKKTKLTFNISSQLCVHNVLNTRLDFQLHMHMYIYKTFYLGNHYIQFLILIY